MATEPAAPPKAPASQKWHGLKKTTWYGIGAGVLVLAYILYRRSQTSAANAATTATGGSIDPATGVAYATELAAAQSALAQDAAQAAYGTSPYGGGGGGGTTVIPVGSGTTGSGGATGSGGTTGSGGGTTGSTGGTGSGGSTGTVPASTTPTQVSAVTNNPSIFGQWIQAADTNPQAAVAYQQSTGVPVSGGSGETFYQTPGLTAGTGLTTYGGQTLSSLYQPGGALYTSPTQQGYINQGLTPGQILALEGGRAS